eukprot:scaffold320213_cov27-Tisochrysis_lutea.AAC.3
MLCSALVDRKDGVVNSVVNRAVWCEVHTVAQLLASCRIVTLRIARADSHAIRPLLRPPGWDNRLLI